MHSFIYQIHTAPIPKDEHLNEDNIIEGTSVCIDYARELEGRERDEAISHLFDVLYKTEMFAINDDNTATYIGGFDKALEAWADFIKTQANEINTENILQFRYRNRLRDATVNPLNQPFLFSTYYTDESGSAEFSEELYHMIAGMNPGDRLYIGAVYDYHF